MMFSNISSAPGMATVLLLFSLVKAQLSGPVGPLTTISRKAAKKTCNVVNYGAVAGSSNDFGPALLAAWNACASGGLVYVPPGTYSMKTWVALNHGAGVAIQLDGIIERIGTAGGTMIVIKNSNDIELFSGTSKGAIQGFGYQFISKGTYGPRLLRFETVTDFSLHGIALVDSPAYYITCTPCTNAEFYNLILRGISIGETDGFDMGGSNIWVHDVEVTNGDECVTVKSPASNYLVESVHCNISGGCAMGSLGLGTSVAHIHYNNIYLVNSGGFYVKTNGGTGTVTGCTFENFISHNSAYTLTINEAWGKDNGGSGVKITDMTYRNWKGQNGDNSRPVVRLQCSGNEPCSGITLTNIDLWTTSGSDVTWECENAFGSGGCSRGGAVSSYAASFSTVKTAPPYAAATMPNDHAKAFPSTTAFSIPPVPTTFFPGLQPISTLLAWTGPANNGKA